MVFVSYGFFQVPETKALTHCPCTVRRLYLSRTRRIRKGRPWRPCGIGKKTTLELSNVGEEVQGTARHAVPRKVGRASTRPFAPFMLMKSLLFGRILATILAIVQGFQRSYGRVPKHARLTLSLAARPAICASAPQGSKKRKKSRHRGSWAQHPVLFERDERHLD